ncbi:unnamed protein product [Paramecium pentaurelia]|uniref:Uncharacterized protein n=1 Tax=Paramecium pentaurelia TaxID=43138 RepID=A0A8S1XLB0_9CILI|nr:unnamed protein product [Paramecium pentaurelia]
MRPQTSETFVREFLDVQMRPKTAKLMTSTQLRNLSAKTSKPNFEFTTKPQVEVHYQKFIPRNFGVLCDQGYYESNKQIQLQKFGRSQNSGTTQKTKINQSNQQQQQQVKKPQVYKLIEIDSRQRQDPESITEREKELKYKRQLLQIINDDVQPLGEIYKTFNKGNHVIIAKLTPMILRKRKVKKEHNPLTLNWNQTKKLLLVKDLTNYIIENMTYQNKKIQLNVYAISGSEFIDEIQKPKDIEFVLEQRRFTCIMPKLIIYCDDINKHATIPLTNLKMSQLLQSNFQEIDNYMSEIDELSNFVIPQKKFPVSILPGKLTKKEKIIKKIVYHEESYYQIAFIPPSIVVSNNIKQIGQYHFSIADLECLASFCFKNPIQSFIKNYIEIITLTPTRASVKVNIPEQYDVVAGQQGLACSENGFLLNQTIESEFKIVYTPASLEFYNPTTLDKQVRIIEEKELQQIIDLDFNFTL